MNCSTDSSETAGPGSIGNTRERYPGLAHEVKCTGVALLQFGALNNLEATWEALFQPLLGSMGRYSTPPQHGG